VIGEGKAAPAVAMSPPEPRWPIGLIALDVDGTLVNEDLELGERTRRAVSASLARGVEVVLATGRMPSSALTFAEALGLHAPLIAYQGALIRAMPDEHARRRRDGRRLGRIVVHTPLQADVARDAVRWCRAAGLDPHLNHLERFIVRADDPVAEDYSRFMGLDPELVPDLVAAIRHPITKVLAVGEPDLVAATLEPARVAFAGRATVTISNPRFLEFLAPGVSKGRALRRVARRLGIPLARTMAVGDQLNDLEMIVAVGHGVAMPTAPQAVLAVARHVAPPLAEEGAAQMIERLVLDR
jgi:Cof subfamily protein (haloacid dehalogenase superfamily)